MLVYLDGLDLTDLNLFSAANKPPAQQYFLQTPKDLTAVEGGTVDLSCQVGALAGDVQWSKDGFLLDLMSRDLTMTMDLMIINLKRIMGLMIIVIDQMSRDEYGSNDHRSYSVTPNKSEYCCATT
ncbi:hypothetical protein CEXT_209291 [Caerostris extrusa]|uniref:Ig-like domain-containing protein n=1 Tax=Caerostris extrusa TaxID=172846 RepID=A0AAV4TZU9_CAEEX|nr:hypothetical protein CEXT_209291 [Caerostris extrusa]